MLHCDGLSEESINQTDGRELREQRSSMTDGWERCAMVLLHGLNVTGRHDVYRKCILLVIKIFYYFMVYLGLVKMKNTLT